MCSMMDTNTNDSMRELTMNKMKYCMHKDDIVIGLGRPMYGNSVNMCHKKAYPSVISTMGGTNAFVKRWIAVHNFMAGNLHDTESLKKDFFEFINTKNNPLFQVGKHEHSLTLMEKKINNMLEFYFVGVSLGMAYAHPHSGDTVATVMVGGLKTVLNGAFPVSFVTDKCVFRMLSCAAHLGVSYTLITVCSRCIPTTF